MILIVAIDYLIVLSHLYSSGLDAFSLQKQKRDKLKLTKCDIERDHMIEQLLFWAEALKIEVPTKQPLKSYT